MLFSSRKGIKSFNQPVKSEMFNVLPVIDEKMIDPKDLYLGFDGLCDDQTMLDLPLPQSPHAGIMQSYKDGSNVLKTEYYKRAINGTLDMRYNQWLSRRKIVSAIEQKKKELDQNTYLSVKVSIVNNRYYIIDGKHSAALCYVNRLSVKCAIIQHPFFDSFYFKANLKMKKSGKAYKKGINFFKTIYEHTNDN